jgi:hypothetical protein
LYIGEVMTKTMRKKTTKAKVEPKKGITQELLKEQQLRHEAMLKEQYANFRKELPQANHKFVFVLAVIILGSIVALRWFGQ